MSRVLMPLVSLLVGLFIIPDVQSQESKCEQRADVARLQGEVREKYIKGCLAKIPGTNEWKQAEEERKNSFLEKRKAAQAEIDARKMAKAPNFLGKPAFMEENGIELGMSRVEVATNLRRRELLVKDLYWRYDRGSLKMRILPLDRLTPFDVALFGQMIVVDEKAATQRIGRGSLEWGKHDNKCMPNKARDGRLEWVTYSLLFSASVDAPVLIGVSESRKFCKEQVPIQYLVQEALSAYGRGVSYAVNLRKDGRSNVRTGNKEVELGWREFSEFYGDIAEMVDSDDFGKRAPDAGEKGGKEIVFSASMGDDKNYALEISTQYILWKEVQFVDQAAYRILEELDDSGTTIEKLEGKAAFAAKTRKN